MVSPTKATKDYIMQALIEPNQTDCRVEKPLFFGKRKIVFNFPVMGKPLKRNFDMVIEDIGKINAETEAFKNAVENLEALNRQEQSFFAKHFPKSFGRTKQINALRARIPKNSPGNANI